MQRTTLGLAAALTLWWLDASVARADVVLYQVPGLKGAVFVLEGHTTVNPGRTLTFRHKLGTLYMALEDAKVFEAPPTAALAQQKLREAVRSGDVEQCLAAGRWAIHHGMIDKFYEAAGAAWQADPTNATVTRLLALKRKLDYPVSDSEKQRNQLREFSRNLPNLRFAESAHFLLLHDTSDDPIRNRTRAQARLELLENVYESFMMKFCLEGVELKVPRERLKVMLFADQQDYLRFVNLLSPALKSAAGFYDRKQNVSVFYDQGTGEAFQGLHQLNRLLQEKKAEAIRVRAPGTRDLVRFAQTLDLLTTLSAENLDVEVVSHEATHHMAGMTGLMPGDSPVPVWAAEGLATYFESPREAAWSGIGAVNEDRLNRYRQLERDTEHSNLEFIVSDKIFQLAASHSGTLHGYGQAWALTHFLMNRHFEKLMRWYGLLASRKQDERLTSEQLLSSFKFVFGDDLTALDLEWRQYMRTLKTDVQIIIEEGK